MKLNIDKILIGERQRIELGDLSDLDTMADKEVGQICPIIIHKTLLGYELVDGMRRLTKAKSLGWTEVEVYEKELLTVEQKQLMEFFADVSRKDRTWQEKCITIYKLFHMLRFAKRAEGEVWTIRGMSKFCGDSKTRLQVHLKVAEFLLAEPRDTELWDLSQIYDAEKLMFVRSNAATTAELQRRRALAAQATAAVQTQTEIPVQTVEGEAVPTADGEALPSLVPNQDPTQQKIKIKLFGRNKEFDGKETGFRLVLGYSMPEPLQARAHECLAADGYVAMWNNYRKVVTIPQSWLYWNRVSAVESKTPFYANMVIGVLSAAATAEHKPYPNPSSGCFTEMDFSDGKELARGVVHALVNNITEEGQTVLCLSGINPCHVAEIGRVPVFYEPDATIYAERLAGLKEEYEQIFPNVEFEE
jgi:hypothetical protein